MIHLAYDGSLNGDWVSRHAVRLAAGAEPRRLVVVHVLDASLDRGELDVRLERIAREAAVRGVEVEPRVLTPRGDVFRTLDAELPRDPEALVVCGTRIRSRRGFLRDTVSQRLLARRTRPVAAIRVVQPGLLGDPRRFLIPLSSYRGGLAGAWGFFRAFLRDAERVYLLRVLSEPASWRLRASAQGARTGRKEAWEQLHGVMDELRRRLPESAFHLDGRVVVAGDWGREIAVQASQLHVRMILMGASDRTLFERTISSPLERVLRRAPCDVGICRSV